VKAPTREPRTIPESWPQTPTYYDHEVVVQEDGSRAAFTWNNHNRAAGWVFSHYEDEAGFVLCQDAVQSPESFFAWMLDGECDSDQKLVRNGRHYLAGDKDPEPVSQEEMERRWKNFIFPVITDALAAFVEGGDIIDQLASVQPMTGPVGDNVIHWATPEEIAESDAKEQKWLDDLVKSLLKPGEVLKEYAYGGVLSGRGGYFVVHQDNPKRVLRYLQTWMS